MRIDDDVDCAWCGSIDAPRAGVMGRAWRICGRCAELTLAVAERRAVNDSFPMDSAQWERLEEANFSRASRRPPEELLRIMRELRKPGADTKQLVAELRDYTNRPAFGAYMLSLSCCFCTQPFREASCAGPGVQACVDCVRAAQQALLD